MKIVKMNISPEQAKLWLTELNAGNRKMIKNVYLFYAQQMIAGQWIEDSGETIKFSGNFDRLIDGQHRLQAIVESKMSIQLNVAIECDEKAFEVIDTGKKRSAADLLSIDSFKYSSTVSAGVRHYLNLISGITINNSTIRALSEKHKYSNSEIKNQAHILNEIYDCDMVASVCEKVSAKSLRVFTASTLFAVIYYFNSKHMWDLEKMYKALNSVDKLDVFINYLQTMRHQKNVLTLSEKTKFTMLAISRWTVGNIPKRITKSMYEKIEL